MVRNGRTLVAPGSNQWPIWDAGGENVTFGAVDADRSWRILRQPASGGGSLETLLTGDSFPMPMASSWSPTANVLAVGEWGIGTRLGFLDLDSGPQVDWVSSPSVQQSMPTFSRDGSLVAYMSNESGENEVYVRRYDDAEDWLSVSNDGGGEPLFCRDCDELFFHRGNQWYAARVTTTPEFRVETPRPVWVTEYIDTPGRSYDVSPDGEILFVVKRVREATTNRISVVQNLFEKVNRLLSSER